MISPLFHATIAAEPLAFLDNRYVFLIKEQSYGNRLNLLRGHNWWPALQQARAFAVRELWAGGVYAPRYTRAFVWGNALGLPGVPPQTLLAVLADGTFIDFGTRGSGSG